MTKKINVAVLFSGGKDSCLALWRAKGFADIKCLVTIISENPDSYMFHPINEGIVEKQAKAIGLPLVIGTTKGEKENELEDLKRAIKQAKDSYQIKGVVAGALYSTYQKERVERIAGELGLKAFSPLWHINPEKEMHELLESGFRFIIIKIAALGLDKSWLGRTITYEDIDRLVELNKKTGIHIAFEGGEAETLVTDAPFFKSKLLIKETEIIMENTYTGFYKIIRIELEQK